MDDCRVNPDSLRDIGVKGNGGKFPVMGEEFGESGLLFLESDAVRGGSPVPLPRDPPLAWRKAFNIRGFGRPCAAAAAPKDVDVKLTSLAREVEDALDEKTAGLSDAKESNGMASTA